MKANYAKISEKCKMSFHWDDSNDELKLADVDFTLTNSYKGKTSADTGWSRLWMAKYICHSGIQEPCYQQWP